jgi:hypothetical protein
MTLRKKLLPSFTKAVSGQTATCNLDLGKKIHIIWLVLGYDATNANKTLNPTNPANDLIGEIRLLVNGKVQRRIRGRELQQLNLLNGAQYGAQAGNIVAIGTAGYRIHVPIFLAEPWRKNNAEAALMAWNLAGVTVASASIEVDFLTIDTPYIGGWYEWSPPDGGLGAITKWIRMTFGASGSQQDFNTLEKRDYYHSIHLLAPTGAYVGKVQLTADGVIVQDLLSYEQNYSMLRNRDMNPAVAVGVATAIGVPGTTFDLVLDADDHVNSALLAQGLQELTLHVEYADTGGASVAATGNLVAIIQRSGPPE